MLDNNMSCQSDEEVPGTSSACYYQLHILSWLISHFSIKSHDFFSQIKLLHRIRKVTLSQNLFYHTFNSISIHCRHC